MTYDMTYDCYVQLRKPKKKQNDEEQKMEGTSAHSHSGHSGSLAGMSDSTDKQQTTLTVCLRTAMLHRAKVQTHLRDLTRTAAKASYWAKSASVQPSALPGPDPNQIADPTVLSEATANPAQIMLQPDWRRNRVKVGDRIATSKIALACISILSSMIVMGQNEWVIRGNDPRDSLCELSKIACLLCSLGMLALLYMEYWLLNILRNLHLHLKRGHVFDAHIPVSTVLSNYSFWGEVFLCCVFLPPGVTGELALQSLDNIVVYRYLHFSALQLLLFASVSTCALLVSVSTCALLVCMPANVVGKAAISRTLLNVNAAQMGNGICELDHIVAFVSAVELGVRMDSKGRAQQVSGPSWHRAAFVRFLCGAVCGMGAVDGQTQSALCHQHP